MLDARIALLASTLQVKWLLNKMNDVHAALVVFFACTSFIQLIQNHPRGDPFSTPLIMKTDRRGGRTASGQRGNCPVAARYGMFLARINEHIENGTHMPPTAFCAPHNKCKNTVHGSVLVIRNNTNSTIFDTCSALTKRCVIGTVPFLVSSHQRGNWANAEGVQNTICPASQYSVRFLHMRHSGAYPCGSCCRHRAFPFVLGHYFSHHAGSWNTIKLNKIKE
ncbi:MAG: hypothetical protein ACTH1B_02320 [Yaniella sp.]